MSDGEILSFGALETLEATARNFPYTPEHTVNELLTPKIRRYGADTAPAPCTMCLREKLCSEECNAFEAFTRCWGGKTTSTSKRMERLIRLNPYIDDNFIEFFWEANNLRG